MIGVPGACRACCAHGWIVLVVLCLFVAGCQSQADNNQRAAEPATPTAPELAETLEQRLQKVREALIAKNPDIDAAAIVLQPWEEGQVAAEFPDAGVVDLSPLAGLPLVILGLAGNPVSDLSPLQGLPLRELDLERTAVTDLAPLSGMPLDKLWLNETAIDSLTPLAGARLTQLSLLGTKVVDLTPLHGMPLQQLWLNDTAVTDLSPLADAPLISLTLHQTPVADLQVARTWPSLQRLHLGESAVTDLRPLAGLRLTRLIFTPERIAHGFDVVRQMDTLQELDTEFRQPRLWSPDQFWMRYGSRSPQENGEE